MHTYHDNLPGFDANNVLHDGCDECEARAMNPMGVGIPHLDHNNRLKLWRDMIGYHFTADRDQRQFSACDRTLMDAMYLIAVFMQRAGFQPDEIEKRMAETNARLDQRLDALGTA